MMLQQHEEFTKSYKVQNEERRGKGTSVFPLVKSAVVITHSEKS